MLLLSLFSFSVSLSQPKATYIYIEVRWKHCSIPNLQQTHVFFTNCSHISFSFPLLLQRKTIRKPQMETTVHSSLASASLPLYLTNCLCLCQNLLEQMPSYFDGLLLASVSRTAGHKCSHTHEDTWAHIDTHKHTHTFMPRWM